MRQLQESIVLRVLDAAIRDGGTFQNKLDELGLVIYEQNITFINTENKEVNLDSSTGLQFEKQIIN